MPGGISRGLSGLLWKVRSVERRAGRCGGEVVGGVPFGECSW